MAFKLGYQSAVADNHSPLQRRMRTAVIAFTVTAASVFVVLFGTIILTAILVAAEMQVQAPAPPAPFRWPWFLLQHPISPTADEFAPLFLNPLFWSVTLGLLAAILWVGSGPFCRYFRGDRVPTLLAAFTAVTGLILILTSPQVGGNAWWVFATAGTVDFIGGGCAFLRFTIKHSSAP